ncbi:GyrI-like domain-containing protein [Cumulibacter soli]|uniref:GyrI-like domain-containing protein n=1 Tax=Cumulibacter soli TaxID=2546344 RepID=UPI001067E1CB|nr:GyrI-like domain-containing protein [Cumulibacter soli]
MAEKIDFKKSLASYHGRRGQFAIVDVPDLRYLMIDGHGDPNTSQSFTGALETLYPIAYKLKFASKTELGRDYVVPPLEGLWTAPDLAAYTTDRDKSRWDWTAMIMVPEWITADMYDSVLAQVAGKTPPPRINDLRLETLSEGRCAQTLHVGAFDDEGPVLDEMHNRFIPDAGYRLAGTHHEVYFSDFRRVAPERMRTLLRQPVTPRDLSRVSAPTES